MKRWVQFVAMAVLGLGLNAGPGALAAEPPPDPTDCAAVATLIKAENNRLSGELRRIQREIAALRADLDQPTLEDVFAGMGYILGLFGTAAFVASRRKE